MTLSLFMEIVWHDSSNYQQSLTYLLRFELCYMNRVLCFLAGNSNEKLLQAHHWLKKTLEDFEPTG